MLFADDGEEKAGRKAKNAAAGADSSRGGRGRKPGGGKRQAGWKSLAVDHKENQVAIVAEKPGANRKTWWQAWRQALAKIKKAPLPATPFHFDTVTSLT